MLYHIGMDSKDILDSVKDDIFFSKIIEHIKKYLKYIIAAIILASLISIGIHIQNTISNKRHAEATNEYMRAIDLMTTDPNQSESILEKIATDKNVKLSGLAQTILKIRFKKGPNTIEITNKNLDHLFHFFNAIYKFGTNDIESEANNPKVIFSPYKSLFLYIISNHYFKQNDYKRFKDAMKQITMDMDNHKIKPLAKQMGDMIKFIDYKMRK